MNHTNLLLCRQPLYSVAGLSNKSNLCLMYKYHQQSHYRLRPSYSLQVERIIRNKTSISQKYFSSSSKLDNGGISSAQSSINSHHHLHPDFLNDLTSTLPHLKLNTNKYELESHGKGESYHPPAPPVAILTPTSNKDVSHILQLCNKYRVPIIPYGTGTSVEGHVAALQPGSISLDMKEFKFVNDDDSSDSFSSSSLLDDPCITVGAGVTRLELNDRLRHTGMQFMVDPGADASIGGMVG